MNVDIYIGHGTPGLDVLLAAARTLAPDADVPDSLFDPPEGPTPPRRSWLLHGKPRRPLEAASTTSPVPPSRFSYVSLQEFSGAVISVADCYQWALMPWGPGYGPMSTLFVTTNRHTHERFNSSVQYEARLRGVDDSQELRFSSYQVREGATPGFGSLLFEWDRELAGHLARASHGILDGLWIAAPAEVLDEARISSSAVIENGAVVPYRIGHSPSPDASASVFAGECGGRVLAFPAGTTLSLVEATTRQFVVPAPTLCATSELVGIKNARDRCGMVLMSDSRRIEAHYPVATVIVATSRPELTQRVAAGATGAPATLLGAM